MYTVPLFITKYAPGDIKEERGKRRKGREIKAFRFFSVQMFFLIVLYITSTGCTASK